MPFCLGGELELLSLNLPKSPACNAHKGILCTLHSLSSSAERSSQDCMVSNFDT